MEKTFIQKTNYIVDAEELERMEQILEKTQTNFSEPINFSQYMKELN